MYDYNSLYYSHTYLFTPEKNLPNPYGFYSLLTLLHSEWPKLYTILAFLSAIIVLKTIPLYLHGNNTNLPTCTVKGSSIMQSGC